MPRERSKPAGEGYASIVGSGLLLVLAVAAVLLGRSKLKNDESALYVDISKLERQLDEVRRANGKLLVDYATLTAPGSLAARIRDMRLGLIMPGDDARVILPEPNAVQTAMAAPPPTARPGANPMPRNGLSPAVALARAFTPAAHGVR